MSTNSWNATEKINYNIDTGAFFNTGYNTNRSSITPAGAPGVYSVTVERRYFDSNDNIVITPWTFEATFSNVEASGYPIFSVTSITSADPSNIMGLGDYFILLNTYIASGTAIPSTEYLCFSKGVLIKTSSGDVPVDRLLVGDILINSNMQHVEVKWIGKQRFNPLFGKDNLPICISAGALGNGLPLRDLYVSPDHAMYLDDCMLVHAKALINGSTIYQVTEWEGDVEYFHIETENHEIIFAEGAPTETFIDNVSRKAFYNHAEYEALYPDAKPMVELDIPRVKYARQLPMAIRENLDRVICVANFHPKLIRNYL